MVTNENSVFAVETCIPGRRKEVTDLGEYILYCTASLPHLLSPKIDYFFMYDIFLLLWNSIPTHTTRHIIPAMHKRDRLTLFH